MSTVIDSSDSDISILAQRLRNCFELIQDHRSTRTLLHQLSDILTIAVLSGLAGGNGWEDMNLYGLSKHAWLSTFLALPNGIPSPDTFRRVFEKFNYKQFESCFEAWVREVLGDFLPKFIAIDGNELRGSYDSESGVYSLHLVSAWSSESQLVLAQVKVSDKSNEITAIPFLLDAFNGEDSIVTIDAMGTQKKIAAKINKHKGDYILSLKANHPTLFNQVSDWFESLQSESTFPLPVEHTTESGHYRTEIRKYWTFSLDQLPALYQSDEWSGLQSIVVVERTRHLRGKTTHEIQFYLSSLSSDSPYITSAIRQH